METRFEVLEAALHEGGTRHIVKAFGEKFEVLCTPRSYGGTSGLYEIAALHPWGERDETRTQGFVEKKDIDNVIESL